MHFLFEIINCIFFLVWNILLHYDTPLWNVHFSGTRNYGIQMAEGKYIAFLDGDDFFAPHAIENILCVIKNNDDVDVVIGRYINYSVSYDYNYP